MGQALFPPPSIFLFPDFEFEYKARRLFPPPRHRNIFLAQRGQNEGDEGRERERETTNCAIFPRPFFPLNQKDAGATGKAGDANITFIATRVIKRNKFLVVRCLLYLFTFFMALRSSLFLPSLSLLRLFPIQEESSIVATLINMKFNSIARSRFSSFLFFFFSFLSIFFHSKLKETQRENVYQTSYAKLHRITSFPFVPIILYRFVNCFLTNNFPPSFFFFSYEASKFSIQAIHSSVSIIFPCPTLEEKELLLQPAPPLRAIQGIVPLDSIRGAKWFDRSMNNKLTKGRIIDAGGLRAGIIELLLGGGGGGRRHG